MGGGASTRWCCRNFRPHRQSMSSRGLAHSRSFNRVVRGSFLSRSPVRPLTRPSGVSDAIFAAHVGGSANSVAGECPNPGRGAGAHSLSTCMDTNGPQDGTLGGSACAAGSGAPRGGNAAGSRRKRLDQEWNWCRRNHIVAAKSADPDELVRVKSVRASF
jgi:hypothetical protein